MIFRILSKEEKSTMALLLYRYLIEKAYKDSEKSGVEYERVVNYVESILTNKKK